MTTVAQDAFTGTAANLTAHTPDVGGSWTAIAGTPRIDGSGHVIANGGNSEAVITSAVSGDVDVYIDNVLNGGERVGAYVIARRSGTNLYWAANDTGFGGNVYLYRRTSGADTLVASTVKSIAADSRIHLQVVGSSPTTLRVRAWALSGSEPGTWDVDTSDATGANQMSSGQVGLGLGFDVDTSVDAAGDNFLVTTPAADMNSPAITMEQTGLV